MRINLTLSITNAANEEVRSGFLNVFRNAAGHLVTGKKAHATARIAERNRRIPEGMSFVGVVDVAQYLSNDVKASVLEHSKRAAVYALDSRLSELLRQPHNQVAVRESGSADGRRVEDEAPVVKRKYTKRVAKKPVKKVAKKKTTKSRR